MINRGGGESTELLRIIEILLYSLCTPTLSDAIKTGKKGNQGSILTLDLTKGVTGSWGDIIMSSHDFPSIDGIK